MQKLKRVLSGQTLKSAAALAVMLGGIAGAAAGDIRVQTSNPENCLTIADSERAASCYLGRKFPELGKKGADFYAPLVAQAEEALEAAPIEKGADIPAGEEYSQERLAFILHNLYYVGPDEMAKVLYDCRDGPGQGTCWGYEEYNTGIHFVGPGSVVKMIPLGEKKLTFEQALSDAVVFDKASEQNQESFKRLGTMDDIAAEFDKIVPYFIKAGFASDAHGAYDVIYIGLENLVGALAGTALDPTTGAYIYFDTAYFNDPASKALLYNTATHELLHAKGNVLNEAKTQIGALDVDAMLALDGNEAYRAAALAESSDEALWTAFYILEQGQDVPSDIEAAGITESIKQATGHSIPASRQLRCRMNDNVCRTIEGTLDDGVRAYREGLIDDALGAICAEGESGGPEACVDNKMLSLEAFSTRNEMVVTAVIKYKVLPYAAISEALERDGTITAVFSVPYGAADGTLYHPLLALDVTPVGQLWDDARQGEPH